MSIIDPALAARVAAKGVPLSADLAEPKLRTLDQVEEELTGVSLSLYEEELDTARLRLALKSARRGRREARARVAELEAQRQADHGTWQHDLRTARSEREATAARIAGLESERHSTNEALDDAVQALCAKQEEPAPLIVGHPLPPRDAVEDVTPDAITRRIAPTQALREDRYDGPVHHTYRIPRDLPEIGGR